MKNIAEFDQKDWMAPYIEFNTERREEAGNDFEKEFFKLMNNSVFGKTMEQVKIGCCCILQLMSRRQRSGSASST